MTFKDMRFVCVCAKHGFEVHDGSKNECCDSAVIVPMLNKELLEKLTPEGQHKYEADMFKLAECASALEFAEAPEEFTNWYQSFGLPLVESMKEAEGEEEQVAEHAGAEEHDQGYNLEAIYMQGFTEGFARGFERGFDTGHKLSVTKK